MPNSQINPITILVVEDNAGDARLIREVFNDLKIINYLFHARDGVEAMDYLLKAGEFQHMPTPDLIILDLNLPRKDGREVLKDIKSNPQLRHIPVVIMTISQAEEDVLKSYKLHANCFVTKPIDLNQFIKVIKSIEEFWFTIVRLPQKPITGNIVSNPE
jgi:two-component system, chemotaxis family, response regulator Rcp1